MRPRLTVCALVFGAGAVGLVLQQQPRADAQAKANPTPAQVQQLQTQIQQLQQQAQLAQLQATKVQTAMQQQNTALQAENAKLAADLKKEKAADNADKKALDGIRGGGMVHVVLLKLKADSEPADAQAVIEDAQKTLSKIKPVRALWAGKPSAKGSPQFLNKDYSVALVLVFENSIELTNYHNDPNHEAFAARHLKKFETPIVYDFEPKKP